MIGPPAWYVSPAMIAEGSKAASAAHAALLRSVRYRLGQALLAPLGSRFGNELPETEHHARLEELGIEASDHDEASLASRHLRASKLQRAVDVLQQAAGFRLGSALVEPLAIRRRWAERAGELPEDLTAQALATLRSAPAPEATWRCLGPPWFTALLEPEGVRRATPTDEHVPDVLLVAHTATEPPDASTREWIASRARGGAKVVFWQLGPGPRLVPTPEVAGLVCADRPSEAVDKTGTPPLILPPSCQPALHHPAHPPLSLSALLPPELLDWGRVARWASGHDAPGDRPWGLPAWERPLVPGWATATEGRRREHLARARQLLSRESVAHRLGTIADALGIPHTFGRLAPASVLACTRRPERLETFLGAIAAQTYRPLEVCLVLHGPGFNPQRAESLLVKHALPGCVIAAPTDLKLGDCLNRALHRSRGEWIFKMDDDDWYGRRHVETAITWLNGTRAGAASKLEQAVNFEHRTLWCHAGTSLQYRPVFWGGALVMRRKVALALGWRSLPRSVDAAFFRDCRWACVPTLSLDPYNAVRRRRVSGDHTYQATFRRFRNLPGTTPLPAGVRPQDFEF